MARKISQEDPALAITFFTSGFYTFRSQLFAPFKPVGVNVVSFHDPVIDGANFENTDKFEWQRRPGFSRYCPTLLPSNEIINQFYFFRNLNGNVIDYFDSTVRLASFTPTGVTTVVPKTTTSQGFISTLGNMTYFSDGAPKDYAKYDGTNVSAFGLAAPTITPTSTGQGFWFPRAHFSLGNAIQDPNGNIEAVTAILINNGGVKSPTFYDTLALAGGIGSWGSGAISTGTVESQTLVTTGHTNYLFLHDFNLQIPVTAVIDGIQVTIPKKIQGGVAVDQSVKLVVGGAVVGSEHASATPWSPSGFVTTTYGGPTDGWSASLTPAQASTQGLSGFGVAIAANVTSTTNYQLVQANAAVSASASSTISTFKNPVTAGNTIIVGVMTFNETLSSVSDSRGNPYTLIATEVFGLHTLYVYISAGAIAGSTSVTATVSGVQGNSFTNVSIHEFSGILQPSPVEVTASNSSSPSVQVAPFNSGTVTVSNTTDLLFSYVYGDVGGTPGITSQPSGWTFIESSSLSAAGGFQQFVSAYFQPNASGSFPASWARGTLGITAAFKTAGSATVTVGGGLPNAPVVTIFYHLPVGTGPGFTGPTEPIWATSLGGIVNDGGVQWTNYGPVLVWYPQTNYAVPVVVLDTNGNLQLAVTATSPVQPWNAATGYTTGQIVSFGGGFWISVLAGTNTGVAPNALYNTFNSGTGVTQPNWAVASNPAVTGAIAPVWNTTIGGTTSDGSYTWTNLGQGSPLASFGHAYVYAFRTVYGHLTTSSPFSNNTGAILGPLNGSIQAFSITSNIVTFFGSNNFIPGNVHTVVGLTTTEGEMLNEQIFTVLTANPSSSFPLTKLQSSATVLTVTAINILNSVGGQSVTFSGVTDAFFAPLLNGQTFTVSAGATSTSFTVPLIGTPHGPVTTTGTVLVNGSWTARTPLADAALTEDSGIAAPLISTIAGQGTALLDGQGFALCNSVATITASSVTANVVTIYASNNFQPGIWVTFAGLTGATYLNGQQLQVIAVDQPVGTQNTWFQVFFVTSDSVQIPDTGTATFNAIEIYRTSDGGGTYLFDGAVTNPGAQMGWIFDDFVIDDNLDILLIAPLFHQNDPPPGAPGSSIKTSGTISAYWQGRLWLVVGNYVYFDSGPDCTNGIPEEAWAPGNRFQFAGPVLNLQPTADGIGLLVFLADRIAAILGGPETISFYATDFLSNFGVSNPNAVFRDGSIIGLFTTQKQYYELLGANKEQIGEHIADYLSTNFNPAKSYVAMHRNGTDVGMFISNGVDRILRYGPNVPSWSVPAFPLFGAGAMQSVETSVGIYSLLLATPNGGIPPSNPQLGVAATYAILAWSGITNTGSTVVTGGNIGSSPTMSITGFPPGVVTPPGVIDNTNAAAAHTAAVAAYAHYAGLTFTSLGTAVNLATSGNGANSHTYVAGNYSSTSSFDIPNTFGGIVLDAQGNANAQFVFFSASTTTLESGSTITLLNGTQAKNVIWVVGSSFTSVATSTMVGTILAQISITLGGGTFTGLALAGLGGSSGAVTISSAEIISTGNTQAQLDQGNYIYTRDLNSWGDGNTSLGANDGTPYSLCEIVLGNITLSQLGGRLFPMHALVGYFDAVGTLNHGGPSYPDAWILPNEIAPTTEVPFIYFPEVIPEPPIGVNHTSSSILALRWNASMVNSFQMSQYLHHCQIRLRFEPENAPNTIKAISFMEDAST